MNFSRPDNARIINRLRVINEVKNSNGLTRAELSSILNINKPSMSDIVSALLEEKVFFEGEKQEFKNGRPGTSLYLNINYGHVIGVDIQSFALSISLFNLSGQALRMERFPLENINEANDIKIIITKAIGKMLKMNSLNILGLNISLNAKIQDGTILNSYCTPLNNINIKELFNDYPFPVSLTSSLIAAAEAERHYFKENLENMLFINWGEHISSAIILKDRILSNPDFGHLPVVNKGLCHCGAVGCLDTVSSGYGIKEVSLNRLGQIKTFKTLLQDTSTEANTIIKESCEYLGKCLSNAVLITGTKGIIIGGGISNINEEYFSYLYDVYSTFSPHSKKNIPLYKSFYKEKGTVQGSGIIALDENFYKANLLKSLGYL